MAPENAQSLFTRTGHRKYLTRPEIDLFLSAVNGFETDTKLLCHTLAYTGCRLSEALALTLTHIDLQAGVIVLETLKQRRKGCFRQVPVPLSLLQELRAHFEEQNPKQRLWPIHRQTAWRRVSQVMIIAHISGPHAASRGLRHGFAVCAIQAGVPLTIVQKWLGHARLSTTAIYTNLVGEEERAFAEKMWA